MEIRKLIQDRSISMECFGQAICSVTISPEKIQKNPITIWIIRYDSRRLAWPQEISSMI